ncbi:MAG: 30S ribosomal protein S3 [Ktedonobacterales bacterium]
MGQKVHPTGFRLGVIEGWQSRWYAQRTYKDLLAEDRLIRAAIQKRLANASISRIEIERIAGANLSVTIHTAKPGIVIGKNGESVERLRQDMEKLTKKKVRLNILEIRNPEGNAVLVARSIAEQLEKRVAFRRAMKQAVQKAMRTNIKGIKVIAGGRLGGAEIARTEKEVEGSVPLQTLRANIDYGTAEAHTTFGVIGVKVWIYHGDVLPDKQRAQGLETAEASPAGMAERGERRNDRDRGPRSDRGDRGGDRGPRFGAGDRDRGPRPGGDRGPRPGGDRGPRPGGDRGPRPGGDRGPRPANASGLASRPPSLARNAGSRTNVRSAEQSVAQSAESSVPNATPSPTVPTVAADTTPQATQAQPTQQPTQQQPEQANQLSQPHQPNPTDESGS